MRRKGEMHDVSNLDTIPERSERPMSGDLIWTCVRQRAGPLVKECRAIRPRLSSNDTPYERTEKNKILRPPRDSSVCRTRVDRLELRLALFGFEGSTYTLTFDREHEPGRFQDVRRAWRSFLYRLKKWKKGAPFDYVYLIEGRHGDHRYHIHLVLRDSDFSPAEVRHLWVKCERLNGQLKIESIRPGGGEGMYIHEAIAARTKQKPYITRQAWSYLTDKPCGAAVKIQVTDSPDCCIVESVSAKVLRVGWQPKAEDLAADDWRLTV